MENLFHTSKYNLYIKSSQIENSGLGVYTSDFISNNTLIDEYIGDIVKIGGPYVVNIDDIFGIDAFNFPRCYMGMLNDASFISKKTIKKNRKKITIINEKNYDVNKNQLKNNCEFTIKKKRCFVYSTRDIQKDEELFVSYGKSYWENY
jgi:hypothetical protein